MRVGGAAPAVCRRLVGLGLGFGGLVLFGFFSPFSVKECSLGEAAESWYLI